MGTDMTKKGNGVALSVLDGMEFETTGLEEIDASDMRVPTKVWNAPGNKPDIFFDTVTEETANEIGCVLLYMHKTNEWREYEEGVGTKTICRSGDRVNGSMDDGTKRLCHGCVDATWQNDTSTGKRVRRCGPVYNLVGIELDKGTPFILRCRKSAVPSIQTYLNKFFIRKHQVGRELRNKPLFFCETKVTLELSKNKKYAMPVFEMAEVIDDRERISMYADLAREYRSTVVPMIDEPPKSETAQVSKSDDIPF